MENIATRPANHLYFRLYCITRGGNIMDYSIFWNILAGILIFGGFLGALLPLLPGPPLAIIVGPFVGAFVGEYFFNPDAARALRSAWGTFVGFVVGTVFKLVVTVAIAFYFVYALIR